MADSPGWSRGAVTARTGPSRSSIAATVVDARMLHRCSTGRRREQGLLTPHSERKVWICSLAVSRSKNDDAWSCTPILGSTAGLRGHTRWPRTVN